MRTKGQEIARDAIHEGMTEYEMADAIDKAIAEAAKSSVQPDEWRDALAKCVTSMKVATEMLCGADRADSPWQRRIRQAEILLASPMQQSPSGSAAQADASSEIRVVSLEKCAAAMWEKHRQHAAEDLCGGDIGGWHDLPESEIKDEWRGKTKAVLDAAGVTYVE